MALDLEILKRVVGAAKKRRIRESLVVLPDSIEVVSG
jgi:hypothetical protein